MGRSKRLARIVDGQHRRARTFSPARRPLNYSALCNSDPRSPVCVARRAPNSSAVHEGVGGSQARSEAQTPVSVLQRRQVLFECRARGVRRSRVLVALTGDRRRILSVGARQVDRRHHGAVARGRALTCVDSSGFETGVAREGVRHGLGERFEGKRLGSSASVERGGVSVPGESAGSPIRLVQAGGGP